jgi:hypothetical protein
MGSSAADQSSAQTEKVLPVVMASIMARKRTGGVARIG